MIDAAGISKGSMYYYFDGKVDLYTYVARWEIERLLGDVGPFPMQADSDAETFSSAMEDYNMRLMIALSASHQLAALIQGWVSAPANPALQRAQQEMEYEVMPWIERTLTAGQSVGAVRSDVPSGLLIAVVAVMGRAMDIWLMTQQGEVQSLPQLIGVFVG